MNEHAQPPERRELLNTARRYRRDGYKVSGLDKSAARPSFLGDVVPDLIAERDDDKVVVQVKRADAVKGSNDMIELAERVSTQPEWRFELIVVAPPATITLPDTVTVGDEVRRLLDSGFAKPAFIMAFALIENLVAYASVRRNRQPANLGFPALVREMVVQGVIDQEMRRQINDARAKRDALLHGVGSSLPTRADVEALATLGHDLQHEILAAESQGTHTQPLDASR